MRRRRFVAALAGAALVPRLARAKEHRRVGVIMSTSDADPRERASLAAFVATLARLGWVEGRNLTLDYRWGAGDAARMAANARAIVALAPDAILVKGANVPAARQATATIPLVFVSLSDAGAEEFVANFARPGGNITGFTSNELTLVGKRLGLLREASPGLERVLYLTSRTVGARTSDLVARIDRYAAATGVTLVDGSAESGGALEAAIHAFAREPHGGMIAAFNAFITVHRDAIVALAARYRLPAIYPLRSFVDGGGLMSYGFDQDEQFRQAAAYVDRILRGAKPADLPVQEPTVFQFVLNLKTARAQGIAIPPTLLTQADAAIE